MVALGALETMRARGRGRAELRRARGVGDADGESSVADREDEQVVHEAGGGHRAGGRGHGEVDRRDRERDAVCGVDVVCLAGVDVLVVEVMVRPVAFWT
jgi:hypothetical protein